MKGFWVFILTFFLLACNQSEGSQTNEKHEKESLLTDDKNVSQDKTDTSESAIDLNQAEADLFSIQGFDDKIFYELLIETHLCNPNYEVGVNEDGTPCSAQFFKFFSYNHKRKINDAFLLQIKAGVNNYPYRRLLIFVRENGKLVLMNGIIGYLVERIPQENEIDDLVVAIFDDLGNDKFDRYDVLLRYENGKYHFVEAIGDLHGKFDNPELKKLATEEIYERILEKQLMF